MAHYGRLTATFAPEDSATNRLSWFDERRHQLWVLPEMDPVINNGLPGGLLGGYISRRERRF